MTEQANLNGLFTAKEALEKDIEKGSSENFSDPEKELEMLQSCCDHPTEYRMFAYCGICGKKVNLFE